MKNLLTNPQPSQSDYINAIVKLGSRVYEAAQVTPLQKMGKLSERLHNNIWIKREDRQPVNSFKLRGAYAMISSLSEEQKAAGVIAASAGNHAQGVALSAKQLGLKALIVMPQNTPSIKVDAVRGFGGEVLLHGANFDEAKAKAIELSKRKKYDIYSTIRSSIGNRWTRHVSDGNATTSGRFGLCVCTSRWWWLSCGCGNFA